MLTATLKPGLPAENHSFNLCYDSEPQTYQDMKSFHYLSYNILRQ